MSDDKSNPATDKEEADRLERCILAALSGNIAQGWGPELAAKNAITYGQAMYIELEHKKVNDRIAIKPDYMSFRESEMFGEIQRLRDKLKEKEDFIDKMDMADISCTNKTCRKRVPQERRKE